ncbi:hypothetical protein UA32_12010 [Photobacterium angustum]|uniref:Phage protein n=1 Tax=Photobacterium angustum TaxID=661 RepID=A0ABX5GXZ7_PHOAN|nr:hypothetical protein [Photobacterium angustum]KJG37681.1 hypothetical protein UA32_12010 [Photobacterium angustum]PSX01649.1 hypothetical protein C0W27_21925 [Photobacterium angustum]
MLTMLETMTTISKVEMLPRYYKEDLDRDFDIAIKYRNNEYIWMLREAGSLLFPLRIGANPAYLANYIQSDSTAIFYFVNADGKFTKIEKCEAEIMSRQEPINFETINTSKELEIKVKQILKDKNITNGPFEQSPSINNSCRVDWEKWYEWFKDNNKLMAKVMRSAIAFYDDLDFKERRMKQAKRLQNY